MRRRECLAVLFCAAAALYGCDRAEGPAEPVWGKQACVHCAMLVQDKRYAAQILTEDGTRLYFDDIGCMIAYADARKVQARHFWVHEELGQNWLDAERARYRRGARTPMDYGFGAGASGDLGFADVWREALARTRRRS